MDVTEACEFTRERLVVTVPRRLASCDGSVCEPWGLRQGGPPQRCSREVSLL